MSYKAASAQSVYSRYANLAIRTGNERHLWTMTIPMVGLEGCSVFEIINTRSETILSLRRSGW